MQRNALSQACWCVLLAALAAHGDQGSNALSTAEDKVGAIRDGNGGSHLPTLKPGAWVFMAYGNSSAGFRDGTLVAIQAIYNSKSVYPVVVLVDEHQDEQLFLRMGCEVRRIPVITPPTDSPCYEYAHKSNRGLESSWTKLNILVQLSDFRRIVYVEADQLMIKNADELMRFEDNATYASKPGAGRPCQQDYGSTSFVNTGVLSMSPQKYRGLTLAHTLDTLRDYAFSNKSIECRSGSQKFEIFFFEKQFKCLPAKFNCKRGFGDMCCGGEDARIIHWSGGVKPWNFDDEVFALQVKTTVPYLQECRHKNRQGCCNNPPVPPDGPTISNKVHKLSPEQQLVLQQWHKMRRDVLRRLDGMIVHEVKSAMPPASAEKPQQLLGHGVDALVAVKCDCTKDDFPPDKQKTFDLVAYKKVHRCTLSCEGNATHFVVKDRGEGAFIQERRFVVLLLWDLGLGNQLQPVVSSLALAFATTRVLLVCSQGHFTAMGGKSKPQKLHANPQNIFDFFESPDGLVRDFRGAMRQLGVSAEDLTSRSMLWSFSRPPNDMLCSDLSHVEAQFLFVHNNQNYVPFVYYNPWAYSFLQPFLGKEPYMNVAKHTLRLKKSLEESLLEHGRILGMSEQSCAHIRIIHGERFYGKSEHQTTTGLKAFSSCLRSVLSSEPNSSASSRPYPAYVAAPPQIRKAARLHLTSVGVNASFFSGSADSKSYSNTVLEMFLLSFCSKLIMTHSTISQHIAAVSAKLTANPWVVSGYPNASCTQMRTREPCCIMWHHARNFTCWSEVDTLVKNDLTDSRKGCWPYQAVTGLGSAVTSRAFKISLGDGAHFVLVAEPSLVPT